MFVKLLGFVVLEANLRSCTWTWHYHCLCIAFPLKLIKISLKKFDCASCVFTVVLRRYRLQRLNLSGAECSFHVFLELRVEQYYSVRKLWSVKFLLYAVKHQISL